MRSSSNQVNYSRQQTHGQILQLITAGQLTEALAVCNAAIRLNAQDASLHLWKARIHARQTEYNQAIESCNTALRIGITQSKELANAHLILADCYSCLEQFSETAQHLELALTHEPEDHKNWFDLIKLYTHKLKNWELALQATSRAITSNVKNTAVYYYI